MEASDNISKKRLRQDSIIMASSLATRQDAMTAALSRVITIMWAAIGKNVHAATNNS